jgi:autotransporter-associated beta strand protein
MKIKHLVLGLALTTGLVASATAQTTWVGNTDNNLNNAANWSAGVPTASLNSIFTTAGSSGTNLSLTADLQFGGGTAPASNAMLFDGAGFTIGGNSTSRMLTIGGQGLAISTNNTITLDVARVRRNASNTFEFLGSNGNLVINGDYSTNVTSASDALSRIDFTGASGNGNTITFNGNIVKIFSPTVAGSGNGNLTISSAGTGNRVVFNNASNSGFTGAITVGSNAELHLGNGGSNGTLSGAGAISLGNSASTFTVNQTDTVTQGTEFSTSITGSGKVVQAGSGTTILNAANTYSGGTQVNAGTLLVQNTTGSATGNGTVTIASGASVGGNGTIEGNMVVSGRIAPGNSIGILNAGSTTWKGALSAGTSTDWQFELGAANSSDLLNITGDFLRDTSTGTAFRFDFLGSAVAGSFKLVDWSGTSNFAFTNFSYTGLGAGYTGTFEISGTQLNFNVVPEPSTFLLLGLGLLFVVVFRRRQRITA